MYTSGSFLVVVFGIIVFYFLCSSIEFLTYKLNKNNFFLTALIGQTLAYRLIHFGVNTSQSYKFLIAIIFTILMCYLLTNLFLEKSNKKT